MSVAPASPRSFAVALAIAALSLVGFEVAARWMLPNRGAEDALEVVRAANVVAAPKAADRLPTPNVGQKSVWLFGNSHTYSLPGLRKGEPMRPDPGSTLIDVLAAEVEAREPAARETRFVRLAFPNFLPTEMAVRVAHLLESGWNPEIVFVGVTYRNVARDSSLRVEVRDVLRGAPIVERLERHASQLPLPLRERYIRALEAEQRQVEADLERERTWSAADRWDAVLTDHVGRQLVLVGRSSEIRAVARRELIHAIEALFVAKGEDAGTLASIESDLRTNLAAIELVVGMLRESGAQVVLYQAPERADLPPIVDRNRAGELETLLLELAGREHISVVDARGVVAPEFWGWELGTPDRSHFTEPGHLALGRHLVREANVRWDVLR